MNRYVYQRSVRTLARFGVWKEEECARVGVDPIDVQRARAALDKRRVTLNVTDSHTFTRASRGAPNPRRGAALRRMMRRTRTDD